MNQFVEIMNVDSTVGCKLSLHRKLHVKAIVSIRGSISVHSLVT